MVLGGIDFYNHKKLSDITAVTKRFYHNWDDDAYQKYMKTFSLVPEKRVKELSTGMKVKYMLALALSHNARLLILDEPTSGLDPVSRDDLLGLFRQLVESKGISILFSTHIITDLEKCTDYITYIKDGQLLCSDEKSKFIKSFQHLKEPGDKSDLSLEEIMIRPKGVDMMFNLLNKELRLAAHPISLFHTTRCSGNRSCLSLWHGVFIRLSRALYHLHVWKGNQ